MNGRLWYYSVERSELGPVTADELMFLYHAGTVGPQTLIRPEDSRSSVAFQNSQLAAAIRNQNRKPITPAVSAATAAPFRSSGLSPLKLHRNTALPVPAADQSVAVGNLPLPAVEMAGSRRRVLAGAAAAAVILLAVLMWLFSGRQPGGFAGTGDGTGGGDSGTGQGVEQQAGTTVGDTSSAAQPATSSPLPAPAAAADNQTASTAISPATADDGGTPADLPAEKSESARPQESGGGPEIPASALPAEGLAVGRGADQRFSISAPGEATFFGIRGSGQRFSWVVDCSGSMSGPSQQLSGTPLQRAKQELLQSLRRLPPGLEFQIIFFDDFCYRFPTTGFVVVSPEAIREAADFIDDIQGGGGTNVQIGMLQALTGTTRPDTVFLLTDGAFDTGTPGFIASRNRNQQTRINTVAFVDRAGESLLRQIADENRGDFRFVP